MERLVSRDGLRVTAVLRGLDRLIFRGRLLAPFRPEGMFVFPTRAGVRRLDLTK